MRQRTEVAVVAAAGVVALTAVLGGGFLPWPRMLIGALLASLWVAAAVEWTVGPTRDEAAAGGVLLWGVVSAVWVGAAPLASKETLTTWVIAWALWCLTRRGSPAGRRTAVRILAVGGGAVAAAVVFAAFTNRAVRVGGLLDNPNVAAALLVPTMALGMAVFDDDPRWRRWTWFLVIGAGIVLTGSRAGLLAALVAVAVMLPSGRVRIAGIVAGGGAALGVLAWRFISQPDLLAWHRVSIWWAVLKIWLARPLTGVGPGCLVEAAGPERILHPDQIGRYQFVVSYAESTPLAVLVQLGIVGSVLVAVVLVLWLIESRRSAALSSITFRGALASMIVLALFHDFLTADPVLWWWAVIVGCCGGSGRLRARSTWYLAPIGPRLAVGLVMAWVTCWGMVEPALARWFWHATKPTTARVERALRAEPWFSAPAGERVEELLAAPGFWSWETAAEGLHWARRAVAVHPGAARRWADLGRVHLRILTDLGGTEHDVEAARTAFDRACELDPHLPWHWLERARLERVLGDHREAVRLTRRALAEEPNTVRGWLMLSRLELELDQVDAAREALAEAVHRLAAANRPGLNEYERELLLAPQATLREIAAKLQVRSRGKIEVSDFGGRR